MPRPPGGAVADALREVLTSPNVCDSNFEPANVVDTLDSIANATAGSGKAIAAGLEKVAYAINDLASAIREGRRA